jgi:hypothetical protein
MDSNCSEKFSAEDFAENLIRQNLMKLQGIPSSRSAR